MTISERGVWDSHVRVCHSDLKEMAGTSQHLGKLLAVPKRPLSSNRHITRIEETHWLVFDDLEPICTKISAPPIWPEVPKLRDKRTTLTMAAKILFEVHPQMRPAAGHAFKFLALEWRS